MNYKMIHFRELRISLLRTNLTRTSTPCLLTCVCVFIIIIIIIIIILILITFFSFYF